MSGLSAGSPSGEQDGGGGPPPVLLAALAVALLIAVGLVAGFSSLRGGDSDQAPDRDADVTATTADKRVLLTVSVDGTGVGNVEITQSDVSCNASCEYKFTRGVRVTANAEPSSGSTFEGWGGACSGTRCSIVMDRPRSLSATFDAEPAVQPLCEGVPAEERDPECPPEDPGTTTTPVEPGAECVDGIDNDDDGLTDTAQDPDCESSGSESGATAPPSATPPPAPPPVTTNDCSDGKDNDDDGLTDNAQDPDCENGRSESGAAVRAPRGTTRTRSECSDRRDNDGDGLIDTAQDPGCEGKSTEAG